MKDQTLTCQEIEHSMRINTLLILANRYLHGKVPQSGFLEHKCFHKVRLLSQEIQFLRVQSNQLLFLYLK